MQAGKIRTHDAPPHAGHSYKRAIKVDGRGSVDGQRTERHTRRYNLGRDVTLLTRLLVPVHSLDVILGPRTVRSTVRSTMDCVNDRYELLQAFVWNRYSLTPGNSAMCTSVYFFVSLQMKGRAMFPDLRRRN